MKTSFKVSLGGVIGALSLVLMLTTSIIPFGTYAFPAFAGMLLICIVFEMGYSWAFLVYTVVSLMSLILLSDKEAALYYVIFLGFYPVLKGLIEKIGNKVLQYIVKILIFNVCIISAFYISIFLLSIPKESFNIFGIYLPWVFLILGNITFVLYDMCVTRIVTLYILKFRKFIVKNNKM